MPLAVLVLDDGAETGRDRCGLKVSAGRIVVMRRHALGGGEYPTADTRAHHERVVGAGISCHSGESL